jgi:AraC family transcriptional regulator, regulatory protein of adaptative response / methylated-DNA-[protein]-cysteine methyltransferase
MTTPSAPSRTAADADYQRIADAIAFLEDNWRRRPSLEEVAQCVGLSKYHFQRLFSRWAGISPKRFVQYLTIERARELLTEDRPLLDVSLDLDLSGPSRLHDLFVSIDAVTPGEFKRRGADLSIGYGVHPCPFGLCLVGLTGRGICFLGFVDDDDSQLAESLIRDRWPQATLAQQPKETAALVRRIFLPPEAQPELGPLPLLLSGTNFQIKVWEALLHIPRGRLATYQEVAAAVGMEKGARAVGSAVGANPISFLVPCHRVIRKGGEAGGYFWGLPRKRAMLWREAAQRDERSLAG